MSEPQDAAGKMGIGVAEIVGDVLSAKNWRFENIAAPFGGINAFWKRICDSCSLEVLRAAKNALWVEVKNENFIAFFKVYCEDVGEVTSVWVTDVTSLKQAENEHAASEARARALIHNSVDLFWALDDQLHLQTFNRAFEYFVKHHYQASLRLGEGLSFLSQDGGFWRPLLLKCVQGETVQQELHLGAQIWSVTLQPIYDSGAVRGVAGSARDVSDERKQSEELRRAVAEAERARLLRSQFMSVLGHEIRTPMQAILGAAEVLNGDQNASPHRAMTAALERNASNMLHLLDELLLHDPEKGFDDIVLQWVALSVDDLILSVISAIRENILQKKLTFELTIDDDVPSSIQGDPARLRQVLLNVIGNAVKFTDEGGVSVRVSVHAQDTLKIFVDDTGPGIAPEICEHLFERHVRAPATSHKPGSGLGLYISRTLLQKMGGEIEASSSTKGTTFALTIPYEEQPHQAYKEPFSFFSKCELPTSLQQLLSRSNLVAASCDNDADLVLVDGDESNSAPHIVRIGWTGTVPDADFILPLDLQALLTFARQLTQNNNAKVRPQQKGLSALVVDDIVDNLWVAQRRLRSMGFDVETAMGAEEAMAHFHTRVFDVVLLDVEMPARDGLSVAREMRQYESERAQERAVIVGYTAHATDQAKQHCLGAGMDDRLVKPVPIRRFKECIDGWLAKRILIVEDDRDVRLVYGRYLEQRERWQVDFATNLAEAAQRIRDTRRRDLVILDADLPDGSSLSFAREMQKAQIPFVVMSGHTDHALHDAFTQAGSLSTWVKPLSAVRFLRALDEVLGNVAHNKKVAAKPTPRRGKMFVVSEVRVEDDIADLVLEFVKERIIQADAILQNPEDRNVRRYGHQLRGTAAAFGFPSLQPLGDKLEEGGQKALNVLSEVKGILTASLR